MSVMDGHLRYFKAGFEALKKLEPFMHQVMPLFNFDSLAMKCWQKKAPRSGSKEHGCQDVGNEDLGDNKSCVSNSAARSNSAK